MKKEDLERETDQLRNLRPAALDALRHFPGVRAVGLGVREIRGQLTGELAFRVYVTKKRPGIDLSRREVLPQRLFGYSVDVHAVKSAMAACCNATRPLVGGIRISPEPFSTLSDNPGTLGCFLSIPPNNLEVALSNEHVIESINARDQRVFQPTYKSAAGFECNLIGKSIKQYGHKDNYSFNGEDHFIDCAVVDLEKVDFVNKLAVGGSKEPGVQSVTLPPGVAGSVTVDANGLITEIRDGSNNVVDTRKIAGSGTAVPNTLVFKVGYRTGLTVGVVSDVNGTGQFFDFNKHFDAPNQIIIQPLAGHRVPPPRPPLTGTRERFALGGDSGSAILDLQNRVVGLMHHVAFGTDWHALASHIAPILQKVGGASVIQDVSGSTHETAAPSTVLARELWLDTPPVAQDLDALEALVRARLSRSRDGRELLALVDNNMERILRLVWTRRAVTVAWHRAHGPAFVALFARALASPGAAFPDEAGGISRRNLLAAMADVLCAHGDAALRADLERLRPLLLEPLAECRDLDDLCARLAERAA